MIKEILTYSPQLKLGDSAIYNTCLKNQDLQCLLHGSMSQPFFQYIYCCISVSIMQYSTLRALPISNAQIFYLCILIPTATAYLTACKVSVHFDYFCTEFQRLIFQNFDKFTKCKVAYLLAVESCIPLMLRSSMQIVSYSIQSRCANLKWKSCR